MRRSIWGFLLLFACAPNIRPPIVDVVMVHEELRRPPKEAMVALAAPEEIQYVSVAIIEGQGRGEGHSYSDVVNAMKKMAGELGADMLVLSQPTETRKLNWGSMITLGDGKTVNVKGIAIRFVETDSTKTAAQTQ